MLVAVAALILYEVFTPMSPNIARIVGNTIAWTLSVLMAILFAYVGGIKLIGMCTYQALSQIGSRELVRCFTGLFEVGGAIGILIPKTRFWSALQIAEISAMATVANSPILHGPGMTLPPAALTVVALFLAWMRRPQTGIFRADRQIPIAGAGTTARDL